MSYSIRRAGPDDAGRIGPLFDSYRQFYGRPAEPEAALFFLKERLERSESIVFLAEEEGSVLGFAQLYPLFSSVRLAPTLLLNDLFVQERARSRGVAGELIAAAESYARRSGVPSLSLSTGRDNHGAQQLYRRMGWQQDSAFLVFTRSLED